MAQSTVARPAPAPSLRWRRCSSIAQDVLLVVVSAVFFYANLSALLAGQLSSVFFAAEQGLLVVLYLTRRRSSVTSPRFRDWAFAAGTWLPLLLRPTNAGTPMAQSLGVVVQLLGLSLTLVAFSYLGRSFGVVAANRGLKVGGPYRLVRHPIYFCHFVTTTGFLVANFGFYNAGILALFVVCQVMRIQAEERVLTETADYTAYKARVPWRLVPGLY